MKHSRVCAILSISTCCLLLICPIKGYAASETIGSQVTMELTGIQGTGYNGDAVYPYYLSVDGSSTSTWGMCVSYDNEINQGESWVAEVEAIATPDEKEAAWLLNDDNQAISVGNTTRQIDDQWAAWEIFSTNAQNATPPDSGAATQLDAAELAVAMNTEPSTFYQQFVIYIPQSGWPSGADVPQNFLGMADFSPGPDAPHAPEPNSLILLGSGLFSLVAVRLRRRRAAS